MLPLRGQNKNHVMDNNVEIFWKPNGHLSMIGISHMTLNEYRTVDCRLMVKFTLNKKL